MEANIDFFFFLVNQNLLPCVRQLGPGVQCHAVYSSIHSTE